MSARIAAAPARPPAKKAPGRTPPRRDDVGSGRLRILGWFVRVLARHPLPATIVALGVVLAVALLWNVLMGQTGRHPAPLFGPASTVSLDPTRVAIVPVPLPVPRPDPATVASIPATDAPRTAAPDPIGTMIRATDAPRPTDAIRASDGRGDASRVELAQRALIRLGYGPLKADGMLGTGTRQAIERFERDRNLSVTGSLGARNLKLFAEAKAP